MAQHKVRRIVAGVALWVAWMVGGCGNASAQVLAPYQDRLMQGDGLVQDEVLEPPYDERGMPRAWSLEALYDQRQAAGVGDSSATGLRAGGFMDTLYYGSLSGSLSVQRRSAARDSDVSFTVRQMGMPFDGGWRLDNALGQVNLPLVDLARVSQRISMGTPPMVGLRSVAHQGGLDIYAASGQAGQVQGYPVSGFVLNDGHYDFAGAQQKIFAPNGKWTWGGMLAKATNVSSVMARTPSGQGRMDAQGSYLSLRRDWNNPQSPTDPTFVQANVLAGSNSGFDVTGVANPLANAAWLEGGFANGAHLHSWGAFRLEPGLAWLDLPMASDLQGGYWRHVWRTRQWSTDAALELFRSISGSTPDGYFSNANVRYVYSSMTSFGAGVSLRRYGISAQSIQLYSQFANTLGSSRAQLDVASAENGEELLRFQFDHDWTRVETMRLSTSVSMDQVRRPGGDSQGTGLSVSADWPIGAQASLSQSLQGRWSSNQTQYTVNAGLSWRFAPGWSVQSSLYAIQGTSGAANPAQSPLSVGPVPTSAISDSGFFVLLRYDQSAGRQTAPVGGPPGAAAGRLAGMVFLDENRNGRREASESGAAGVTVFLDSRFSVQTDNQGRFDFPYVAAGPHVITVSNDNLPLPWTLEDEGRTEVGVFTRGTSNVDIGARRQP